MKRSLRGYRWYGRSQFLGLLLGIGLFVPSSALAAGTHQFLEIFGSIEKPTFVQPLGLAVDQSAEDLLVIDGEANTISRWNADGTPAEFSALGSNLIDGLGPGDEVPGGEGLFFGSAGEVQIAVDNSGGANDGNIYVPQIVPGAETPNVVDIFASTGEFLGQLTESIEGAFNEPCGIAVDPSGNLYVGDFSGHIHKYEPAANPPVNGDNNANLPFASNCTLVAGTGSTAGFIFPVRFGGEGHVSKLDSTTGEEKYEVAGPTTTVSINPATGHLYTAVRNGAGVSEYDASGEGEATLLSSFTPVAESEATGIAVDEATGNGYVASAGSANIEVWGPVLPEAVTGPASVVGGNVTLRGTVSAAAGSPASCFFEYVETSAEGFEGATSVPCSPAGPFTGSTKEAVSAEVSGLPEAFFRFRLVASNAAGESVGATRLFNTLETLPGLPDGRAYEMVSPQQKLGEVIPPEASLVTLGGSCEDCLPGAALQTMPMQSTPDGEAVLFEGQPFSGGLASGPNEYIATRGASGWATKGLSEPLFASIFGQGYQAFSADLSRGLFSQVEPTLSPQAPYREDKGFANLYLRSEDGSLQPLVTEEPPNRAPGLEGANRFQTLFSGANSGTGASTAFGHIVFQANDALTEEVFGIAPVAPEGFEVGKECSLPGAGCNLYEWVGGQLRLVNVLPDNASAAPGGVLGSGRLQAGSPSLEGPAVDHAISDDGNRIFWSEEESGQLYVRIDGEETREIKDPGLFLTATPSGSKVLLNDGCLYDLEEEECEVDLSQGQGGKFQGILGAAEDLSGIYFVDTAVLSSGENANGEQAEEGKFNLYAWEKGTTSFIGILLGSDNGFSGYGDWRPSRSIRTAQVSADGGYLTFMSKAPLTGYDNTVSGGGECKLNGGPLCSEIFVYAAGSGDLSCASCNPSGRRPIGPSNLSVLKGVINFPPFRQPSNLSSEGGGRLFFESLDPLSSRDTNGKVQDVYEWEPQGVGSCERSAGCIYLISSGASANDSMFLDSTASGGDAFFITRQQLLPRDKDEQLDLYDARVGGGFPEAEPSPCEGEACKGPVSGSPPLGSPVSQEFSGPGNPPKQNTQKHKKKHKKHKKHKRGAKRNRGGSK